ncbi:rubrerythrin family protein [Anaerocolumna sp.]|uniref:rubrerythrin family protein n=1 Tax=Anaerocolumna sp. TaxID=2041569 RepID=UPI0028AF58E3|nr:rubrerythrin family protein [Anaerocolumna sp.]
MDFQQSRTYTNLQNAFDEEAISGTKFSIYAQQARQEGFIQIGNIFDIATHHEREHAVVFLRLLNNYQLPDTLTNLIEASTSEENEGSVLYRQYAEVAREEGFNNIAALFDGIANIEMNMEVTFRYFASLIERDQVFCKPEETLWICTNCGNIMGGLCAPEICPICGYPQGYYQVYSPNS